MTLKINREQRLSKREINYLKRCVIEKIPMHDGLSKRIIKLGFENLSPAEILIKINKSYI